MTLETALSLVNRKIRDEGRLTLELYSLSILIREAFLEDLVGKMSQINEKIVFYN